MSYGFGYDDELAGGYQDADLEMLELEEAGRNAGRISGPSSNPPDNPQPPAPREEELGAWLDCCKARGRHRLDCEELDEGAGQLGPDLSDYNRHGPLEPLAEHPRGFSTTAADYTPDQAGHYDNPPLELEVGTCRACRGEGCELCDGIGISERRPLEEPPPKELELEHQARFIDTSDPDGPIARMRADFEATKSPAFKPPSMDGIPDAFELEAGGQLSIGVDGEQRAIPGLAPEGKPAPLNHTPERTAAELREELEQRTPEELEQIAAAPGAMPAARKIAAELIDPMAGRVNYDPTRGA